MLQLSTLQKLTCQAIVNIFETGKVQGSYGQVTLLRGDSGQLTYGRSQTTLGSGNLHLLIKAYCAAAGAAFARALESYLDRLAERDTLLNEDANFRGLLRQAGNDPVMRATQDEFFDRVYWAPAVRSAAQIDVGVPLGVAIVYDSHIHGSWQRMSDRTDQQIGPPKKVGELAWLEAYVRVRREWLATHPNSLLQKTVYRMDSFDSLIVEKRWDLALPFTVRGMRIDELALASDSSRARVSAFDPEEVVLKLRAPTMRGNHISKLQTLLNLALGANTVSVDGEFGTPTDAAVRAFQKIRSLTVDGIVGPATWASLRES